MTERKWLKEALKQMEIDLCDQSDGDAIKMIARFYGIDQNSVFYCGINYEATKRIIAVAIEEKNPLIIIMAIKYSHLSIPQEILLLAASRLAELGLLNKVKLREISEDRNRLYDEICKIKIP